MINSFDDTGGLTARTTFSEFRDLEYYGLLRPIEFNACKYFENWFGFSRQHFSSAPLSSWGSSCDAGGCAGRRGLPEGFCQFFPLCCEPQITAAQRWIRQVSGDKFSSTQAQRSKGFWVIPWNQLPFRQHCRCARSSWLTASENEMCSTSINLLSLVIFKAGTNNPSQ